MKSAKAKKIRRKTDRYISLLLSHMDFQDRLRFIWSGSYYKPLQRTQKRFLKNRSVKFEWEKYLLTFVIAIIILFPYLVLIFK